MYNPFENFSQNLRDSFMNNPIIAVLDILIFATLLYIVFVFLKKNNATKIIYFIVPIIIFTVFVINAVSSFLLLGRVIIYFILFSFFGFVVLFPQDIRRLVWKITSSKEQRGALNIIYDVSDMELLEAIENIVRAVQNMAKKNIGALMVIMPNNLPEHILQSGTQIMGKVTCQLLETIFSNRTPLHDGAVCIKGNQIISASCYLPLSQDANIDKNLGTRHRAAMGVTETYNVFSIIVSEETGVISVSEGGKLWRYYDSDMLRDALKQVYGLKLAKKTKNSPKARKDKSALTTSNVTRSRGGVD